MLSRSVLLLSLIGAALANSHGSNHHAHLAARDALRGAAPVESSLFKRALGEDSSENHAGSLRLAKRSQCSKASSCKSKLKANAVHKCISGHCAQVCKSGYKSSYGKCVKKAAAKKKSTTKKKASSTKKTTAAKAAATGKKASSSKKGTVLASSNIQSFLGTNTGIGSWYVANLARDDTNGRSWCEFNYNNDSPVFAPSVGTMRKNFGYDNAAAATAYCGLEAIVTTPDGKSKIMYLGDGFDDTWVLSPGSIDLMVNAFADLFGKSTSNKNDVIKGITWELTGNRNDKYKYRGQGDA